MARSESASRGGVLGVLTLIALVALAGFGIRWYLENRTNPKDQAAKFLTAAKTQDWKTLYETMEMDTAQYPDAQKYAETMTARLNDAPAAAQIKNLLQSVTFTVSEPEISGREATVPVQLSVTLFGQPLNQNVPLKMKNFGGIWKVAKDNQTAAGMVNLGGLGGLLGK
jgi:hypothetical protein